MNGDAASPPGTAKGYVIVELEVFDPVGFEQYRAVVAPLIEAAGGRYIVRGGAMREFEGGTLPGRAVVLEFPSLAMAEAFVHSDAYQPAIPLRQNSAKSRIYLVEGIAP
jgi:uncharacterized protein (DUF1330 family)